MGLQYHVQVLHTHGTVSGFSGDFPRAEYASLQFITGKTSELVAQEGWSQLVSYSTASEFMRRFAAGDNYRQWRGGHFAGELYRITVA